MRNVFGKPVYDTLEEKLDPPTGSLIVRNDGKEVAAADKDPVNRLFEHVRVVDYVSVGE